MVKILKKIKGIENLKFIIMPVVIVMVLISVYIFNSLQKNGSAIVYADGSTFVEASGTVEDDSISVSSEVTGTVVKNMLKEGDGVNESDVIVIIENTTLSNQYDQALINLQLAESNIMTLESSIINLKIQNSDAIQQAKNAYLSAEAEYQKVMDGASDDEIKQAEETVSQAKINLEFMKVNMERSKELYEQQVISQSKYDEALKSYNVSEAQYNFSVSQLNLIKSYPTEAAAKAAENKMLQAKAGYDLSVSNGNAQLTQLENQIETAKVQLSQAESIVGQTEKELDKLTIRSPIDGVVNSLLINEGELVTMGKLVAEIDNPNNVEIKAYVSEANIGLIKLGQETNIFVDSYMNEIFPGKVVRINNRAEFTPKNIQTKEERMNTVFEVTIETLDTKGIIKSGMPVDVNIKID